MDFHGLLRNDRFQCQYLKPAPETGESLAYKALHVHQRYNVENDNDITILSNTVTGYLYTYLNCN